MARFGLLTGARNFLFFTRMALKQKQPPIQCILWSKAEGALSWPLASIWYPRAWYQHIMVSDIGIILHSKSQQCFTKYHLKQTISVGVSLSYVRKTISYVRNCICTANIMWTPGMLHQDWQIKLLSCDGKHWRTHCRKTLPMEINYFFSAGLSWIVDLLL